MSSAAVASPAASPKPKTAYGPGHFLYHVWVIIALETKKVLKDPAEVVSRSAQPALWLVIFGEAFNNTHAIPTGSANYLSFLAPGILAQSITFVSIFNGLSIIWEKDMGLMQKVLCTPIQRSALVLGKMLAASSRAFIQLLVILAMSLLLGIHFIWTPERILGVVAVTILGATFFSGMSMVLAALVRTRERMMGIGQLATMPLFFASSALYPVSMMPSWLQVFATLNPMSYLVNSLRGLLIDPNYSNFALDAGVLFVATVVILYLATRLYPRLLS